MKKWTSITTAMNGNASALSAPTTMKLNWRRRTPWTSCVNERRTLKSPSNIASRMQR